MCRDNNHGGRRCPHDTSEKRQARRLAERSRKLTITAPLRNGSDVWETIPTPPHYSDLEGIKREIAALQSVIKDQDPTLTGADQATIDRWDQDVEARLTTLGKVLGARAESLAGFRVNELEQVIEERAAELYNPVTRDMEATRFAEVEIRDALESLYERAADNNPSLPIWQINNWGKEDFEKHAQYLLTDENRALLDRLSENEDAQEENRKRYRSADATYDEERKAIYEESRKRLTKAYQQVIAELREVGGTIEINYTGFNQNYAVEDLLARTAGEHYPRAWVEAHNNFDGPRMAVVPANGRPNFEPQGGFVSDRSRPHVEVPRIQTYMLTLKTEDDEVIDMINSVMPETAVVGSYEHFIGNGSMAAIQLADFEVGSEDESQRPSGDGWEFKSSIQGLLAEHPTIPMGETLGDDNGAAAERRLVESIVKPRWYRPSTERQRNAPVLRIFETGEVARFNDNQPETSDAGVAYHEMGHRMEQVLPHNILARQERAFLMRRANKSQLDRDEQFENLKMIRANEFAHQDTGMVDSYMSKEYFFEDNYEVFTTGIEALYGQAYGGLVGHSVQHTTKDYEHRGFVLGALAVL